MEEDRRTWRSMELTETSGSCGSSWSSWKRSRTLITAALQITGSTKASQVISSSSP
ncbi:hypothetical protein QTP70_010084 [Hemibagrus guttatus]|uniref:Uncharacterized protein n=1 Tax=Hemibagrus guttatus TaxID=175788 RepID=A0AAE0QDU7_9TELE|nr:hypothetical protein QTP70_010084 [Hemibagrus guttatus]